MHTGVGVFLPLALAWRSPSKRKGVIMLPTKDSDQQATSYLKGNRENCSKASCCGQLEPINEWC